MRFGKGIALFFLRPIYRALFESPLAEIAARLQRVELLSSQLRDAEANLSAQLHTLRAELVPYLQRAEAKNAELSAHLCSVDANLAERLRGIEANRGNEASNAAHWNAIEELVLALFRLPESGVLEFDSTVSASHDAPAGRNGLHATSTLR